MKLQIIIGSFSQPFLSFQRNYFMLNYYVWIKPLHLFFLYIYDSVSTNWTIKILLLFIECNGSVILSIFSVYELHAVRFL